jgi:hypothetical protein
MLRLALGTIFGAPAIAIAVETFGPVNVGVAALVSASAFAGGYLSTLIHGRRTADQAVAAHERACPWRPRPTPQEAP